jgi:hypothetical protein
VPHATEDHAITITRGRHREQAQTGSKPSFVEQPSPCGSNFQGSSTKCVDSGLILIRALTQHPTAVPLVHDGRALASAPGTTKSEALRRVPHRCHTAGCPAVNHGHSRTRQSREQDRRSHRSDRMFRARTSKLVMRVRFPSSALKVNPQFSCSSAAAWGGLPLLAKRAAEVMSGDERVSHGNGRSGCDGGFPRTGTTSRPPRRPG